MGLELLRGPFCPSSKACMACAAPISEKTSSMKVELRIVVPLLYYKMTLWERVDFIRSGQYSM